MITPCIILYTAGCCMHEHKYMNEHARHIVLHMQVTVKLPAAVHASSIS